VSDSKGGFLELIVAVAEGGLMLFLDRLIMSATTTPLVFLTVVSGVGGIFSSQNSPNCFFAQFPCVIAHFLVAFPDVFHTFFDQLGALIVKPEDMRNTRVVGV